MQKAQYITIAAAIILTALLYWGGNTIPPARKPFGGAQQPGMAGGMPSGSNTMKPASFDSILAASKLQLPKIAVDEVRTIENELTAMHDSSRMASVFLSLSKIYERNKLLPVTAYYRAKAAKLDNSEKKLTFAGQFFLDLTHDSTVSQPVQLWEAQEAVSCLQRAVQLDPKDDTAKLALASGYIEGTGEPMRGVQILLAMVREKPDDIPVNMMLGKMAVQSGQFDKAVGRFETVLKQEPKNTEALYFMAEAYKGKGDKKKAIELFEECKAIVNKPDFSRDIDQYINQFK